MFRRYSKYLVLKLDDIDKYLSPEAKLSLEAISQEIGRCRTQDGKKDNSYIVVNEDDPYAEVVWKLIEVGEKLKGR